MPTIGCCDTQDLGKNGDLLTAENIIAVSEHINVGCERACLLSFLYALYSKIKGISVTDDRYLQSVKPKLQRKLYTRRPL